MRAMSSSLAVPVIMWLLPVTILLLVSTAHDSHASSGTNHTCMQRWMLQAGIPLTSAVTFEQTFQELRYGEQDIQYANKLLLSFLLDRNMAYTTALGECLAGTLAGCESYDPCATNGKCALSVDNSTYKCGCADGRKGKFCQHDVDECSSKPCQHGGFCKDGVNSYACVCAAGFDGANCEHKWLKASTHKHLPAKVNATKSNIDTLSDRLEAMVKKVANMENEIAVLKAGKTVIGYKFTGSQYNTHKQSGEIRSLRFYKKRSSSLLRLSFSATLGTNRSPQLWAEWYFVIDGRKCTRPSNIDVALFQDTGDNTHVPGYLTGICRATSAGPIGRGTHTIAVNVESNALYTETGWRGNFFLEVQEILPPF